ncbi:MAG: hypothetical protein AAGA20_16870 [Planctomycetota bacterium]
MIPNEVEITSEANEAGTATAPPPRRGDPTRCPVCGSEIHEEAYHCPHCGSDFCYHCRARLFDDDIQTQCTNLECEYYGKTICSVCNAAHEREEEPSVYYEPIDGIWPLMVLVYLVLFVVLWIKASFIASIGLTTLIVVGVGFLLQKVGISVLGASREVVYRRRTTEYPCIACGEPTRVLRAHA